MNTNNSYGDKAPFVALYLSVGRRSFWSLDLLHAQRAARAWARKHGTVCVWVRHAACSSDVENADGSPSASAADPTRTP